MYTTVFNQEVVSLVVDVYHCVCSNLDRGSLPLKGLRGHAPCICKVGFTCGCAPLHSSLNVSNRKTKSFVRSRESRACIAIWVWFSLSTMAINAKWYLYLVGASRDKLRTNRTWHGTRVKVISHRQRLHLERFCSQYRMLQGMREGSTPFIYTTPRTGSC